MLHFTSDGSPLSFEGPLILEFSVYFLLSVWLVHLTAPRKILDSWPGQLWYSWSCLIRTKSHLTSQGWGENLHREEFNESSRNHSAKLPVPVWPRGEFGRQENDLFWSDEDNISAEIGISAQVINRWSPSWITQSCCGWRYCIPFPRVTMQGPGIFY